MKTFIAIAIYILIKQYVKFILKTVYLRKRSFPRGLVEGYHTKNH